MSLAGNVAYLVGSNAWDSYSEPVGDIQNLNIAAQYDPVLIARANRSLNVIYSVSAVLAQTVSSQIFGRGTVTSFIVGQATASVLTSYVNKNDIHHVSRFEINQAAVIQIALRNCALHAVTTALTTQI